MVPTTAARRHDSGLLKFRTPTEIQVPLLAAASMARISSYADIRGVGRAADAVEVGSRPWSWFRLCPAPLLAVRNVGTRAGSIDAVTSGTPRAADGGTGTPVASRSRAEAKHPTMLGYAVVKVAYIAGVSSATACVEQDGSPRPADCADHHPCRASPPAART